MYATKYTLPAGLLLALASTGPAAAQAPNFPYVELESTSVNVGIGGQSGDGILRLPNLGTNCTYPFQVSGFGAGVHVGVSKVSASGGVQNLTRVADLSGDYGAAQGEATIGDDGIGEARFTDPENQTVALPKGTLFPVAIARASRRCACGSSGAAGSERREDARPQ